jgi:hypothetical protein
MSRRNRSRFPTTTKRSRSSPTKRPAPTSAGRSRVPAASSYAETAATAAFRVAPMAAAVATAPYAPPQRHARPSLQPSLQQPQWAGKDSNLRPTDSESGIEAFLALACGSQVGRDGVVGPSICRFGNMWGTRRGTSEPSPGREQPPPPRSNGPTCETDCRSVAAKRGSRDRQPTPERRNGLGGASPNRHPRATAPSDIIRNICYVRSSTGSEVPMRSEGTSPSGRTPMAGQGRGRKSRGLGAPDTGGSRGRREGSVNQTPGGPARPPRGSRRRSERRASAAKRRARPHGCGPAREPSVRRRPNATALVAMRQPEGWTEQDRGGLTSAPCVRACTSPKRSACQNLRPLSLVRGETPCGQRRQSDVSLRRARCSGCTPSERLNPPPAGPVILRRW